MVWCGVGDDLDDLNELERREGERGRKEEGREGELEARNEDLEQDPGGSKV